MRESSTSEHQTSEFALTRRSRRNAEKGTTTMDHSTPEDDSIQEIDSNPENDESGQDSSQQRPGFRHWRRQRPFISGVLVVLGGIELFFSGQLDTGNLHIQFGIEGLQATIIPIALVVLGLFAIFQPKQHMFYGIIALVLAVYSLIGVNLGGFIIGMLLASIGSVLVVAWMGPRDPVTDAERKDGEASAGEEGNS
ncbi:DUF6114 domain-containing protein [Brevibacterium sp. ZH18]|uniref:DUF6114 domain-containing protein n=1 Tax=Brevibacterium sp. ZH18 TaxID=2927784 RepID=UPI001F600369|nr:DUF6114 domain-containing protein [Brevibacterium sp. ZH18]MCI4012720.1 DUF1634 domain-containing protein [Brevibacterium sp. ZH18]